MSRRAFFRSESSRQRNLEPVTPEAYGQLVSQYRSGRFVETARRVGNRVPMELRRAQRGFFDQLPPADEPEGFRGRLAAALMHAETVTHFGWNHAIWVVREPVDELPREWVRGLPDHFREEAVQGWGEKGAADLRKLIWREVILTAARARLARMDLLSASRVLEEADPRRDAALEWQLAVVWSARAALRARKGTLAGHPGFLPGGRCAPTGEPERGSQVPPNGRARAGGPGRPESPAGAGRSGPGAGGPGRRPPAGGQREAEFASALGAAAPVAGRDPHRAGATRSGDRRTPRSGGPGPRPPTPWCPRWWRRSRLGDAGTRRRNSPRNRWRCPGGIGCGPTF